MRIWTFLCLIVLVGLSLKSCYYDNEEELYPSPCDTTNITYTVVVEPIISSKCATCHYGASPSSGTRFDTYETFSTVAASPTANLLCRIKWESGCSPMPSGGSKLSDCSIQQIEHWINIGMPN